MDFREEIVRQICGFPEYGDPPVSSAARPAEDLSLFKTQHIPVISDLRRNCVVCYKQGRGQRKVYSHSTAKNIMGYEYLSMVHVMLLCLVGYSLFYYFTLFSVGLPVVGRGGGELFLSPILM